MVADVWSIAEDFSEIKRDMRMESRIRMRLVGLSALASGGGRLCAYTLYRLLPACYHAARKREMRVGHWSRYNGSLQVLIAFSRSTLYGSL